MNKRYIHFGLLLLIALGYYWSTVINPGQNAAHHFGFGLGMFLIPAIPSFIIAAIHRGMSKKKAQENDLNTLDGEEPKMKKRSYWIYFSSYCTAIGLALFLILVMDKK